MTTGPPDSLIQRLLDGLRAIVALDDDFLDLSEIDHVPRRALRMAEQTGVMAVSMPDSQWKPVDSSQAKVQRELLRRWTEWKELALLVLAADSSRSHKRFTKTANQVTKWLDRSRWDHSVPPTISEAKEVFRRHVAPLHDALALHACDDGPLIAVPDTNVLIREPDLGKYGAVLGADAYEVLLVPGVLSELDRLKVNHRNPEVREKAKGVVRRLKGWRNQGSLPDGARVVGDVFIRVEGREPDFSNTLSWLDPGVADDRIIASVLEVQRRWLSSAVVLLTGDIVMMAKADLASIPTVDLTDP
jgi:hypothetical protein